MLLRPFGKDEQSFVLYVPQWQAVEKACDCGLGQLAQRLAPLVHLLETGLENQPGGLIGALAAGRFGEARLSDLVELLAQGLVGGGKSTTDAYALVRAVLHESLERGRSPLLEFGYLGFQIASRAAIGFIDEAPVGEPKGAPAKPTARRRSRTARPASPTSTPARP